ncbi:MAG: hypothetical protein II893_04105 [Methanomicrobium sp.]|nr:hypothetical protein [Methanomicrobium sp.]
MPRENIISGGLDDAFGGSNRPDKKSRVSGNRSEGIIDDFGNETGGKGSYAGKGGIKNDGERGRRERPSDNSGMFESSFGSSSGRSSPKFTSSSSISRGTDIFDTDFGSARGNRLSPKTHSVSGNASSKSGDLFDREPASGAGDGNAAGPARDDLVYGSEPPKPKSTDEYMTKDQSDIFSDGFGSDEAGWMSAKRKFGEKRYDKRIDEKPEVSSSNLGIGGNDIFATKIAVNPLENPEDRGGHADISKTESFFGTDAHHEPAPSPYGEDNVEDGVEDESDSELNISSETFPGASDENPSGIAEDSDAPQDTLDGAEHGGISFRSESDLHFGKETSDDLYDENLRDRTLENRPKAVAYTMEDDLRAQRQAEKLANRSNSQIGSQSGLQSTPYEQSGNLSDGSDSEYDDFFDELTTPVSEPQSFRPSPARDPLYAGYNAADEDYDDIFEDEEPVSREDAVNAPVNAPVHEEMPPKMPEERKTAVKKFNYMETDDSDLFGD